MMPARPLPALSAALLATLVMAAPVASHDDHGDETHTGELNGVHAVHAWVQAGNEDSKLLFVEIENESDADVMLVGGETEAAESVDLVGFTLKDGETVYETLPSVPIKAGTEMVLAPNGLALRLNGMREAMVEGTEHEIEIEFDIGHIEMHFQVEPAGASQHSHAGHQH